jgi:hypothetical protein
MSAPKGKDATVLPAAVTITTTAETLAITSAPVATALQTNKAIVYAWLQLTLSANATAVTLKLYRGATITATLVLTGDAINVTASTKVELHIGFAEALNGTESVQYTVSATVAGASANSTVDKGLIAVDIV